MKSEAEIIRARRGAVGVNLEDRAPHGEPRSVISLTLPTVFGGARPGPRRELEALGVARASTASAVSLMAMAASCREAAEDREFDTLAPAMRQAEGSGCFSDPDQRIACPVLIVCAGSQDADRPV
jgi:hypothetical protein